MARKREGHGDTTFKSQSQGRSAFLLYLNKGTCGPCDNNFSGRGLVISESTAHRDFHPCGQDPVKEPGYCHLTEASVSTKGTPCSPLSWPFSSSAQCWAMSHQLRTQSWQAASKWPLGEFLNLQ